MKLLFLGTPAEAVPFLEQCAVDHEVLSVVTRPDRPAGRGLDLQSPPIKTLAEKLKIPVYQPDRPTDIVDEIRKLGADAAVVVAYGKLLRREVLDSTRLGFLNVHFSLLPAYRGAAPIERALIGGERRSGVTLFWLDEGMDTGPIQAVREMEVGQDVDAIVLKQTLIATGLQTLRAGLADIAAGRTQRMPQQGQPSLAPKLTRQEAQVDFDRPAESLHNLVRGLAGGPRAFIRIQPKGSVAILRTRVDDRNNISEQTPTGTVLDVDKKDGILIQCCPGRIWVVVVQPEGKRQIAAADFANGLRLKPGDRLICFPHD